MFRNSLEKKTMRQNTIARDINPDDPQATNEPARPVLHNWLTSPTHVDTVVAAHMLLVNSKTLHRSHSQKGTYAGIRPVRLPSRKLAWPLDEIQALLSGEAK